MKLTRLLDHHQKYQRHGIPENFGDGFLMVHNGIFRRVREAALNQGYRFSHERNEAYETFPLLQLESVLERKIFPVSNNVAPFESLSQRSLERLSWSEVDGNLKKNFVFHEAAHGVIRTIAQKNLGHSSSLKDGLGARSFALRMLFEESCANATELLGISETVDQTHRIFYEMNSYVCEFESRTNLKNAMADIGSEVVAKFMILAYLESNFLKNGIEEKQFKELVALSSPKTLTPQQLKTLKAIGKISFNLSERFRFQTTSFHLRLNGIDSALDELFDFDYLKMLKSESGYMRSIEDFVSLIVAPL